VSDLPPANVSDFQPALTHFAESYASELEMTLTAWAFQELTLEEASSECGLTYDTLQRRVSRGMLANAGSRGRPRVRRCDLLAIEVASRGETPLDLADEIIARRRARDGQG
jgi:hypothetical protein